MNKEKAIIALVAVLINVGIVGYFFTLKKKSSPKKIAKVEIPDRKPVFSDIDSKMIDDFLSQLSLKEKIQRLLVQTSASNELKTHVLKSDFTADTSASDGLQFVHFSELYSTDTIQKVFTAHFLSGHSSNDFEELCNDLLTMLPYTSTDVLVVDFLDPSTDSSYFAQQFQKWVQLKDSLETKGILMGVGIDERFDFRYIDSLNRYGFPILIQKDTSLKAIEFRGLKVLQTETLQGVKAEDFDLLMMKGNPMLVMNELTQKVNESQLTEKDIDQWLRTSVAAELWVRNKDAAIKETAHLLLVSDTLTSDSLKNIQLSNARKDTLQKASQISLLRKYYERKILAGSFVLLNKNTLPLRGQKRINLYSKSPQKDFQRQLRKKHSVSNITLSYQDSIKFNKNSLIWIDTLLDAENHQNFIQSVIQSDAIIINQNHTENIQLFENKEIVQIFGASEEEQFYLAQVIYGAHSVRGLPFFDTNIKKSTLLADVLGDDVPEGVKLSKDTLRRINYIVNHAINSRAFPGAQVLVAKKGKIIYNQSFGHHTYTRQKPVSNQDLYDIASVTKVAATTLLAMKLLEDSLIQLDDSLWKYLPEDTLKPYLKFPPSTIRNITIRELLIHRSGLPAGMNLIGYMLYTDTIYGRYDKYYCDLKDTVHTVPVAENFYLEKGIHDSLWVSLNQIYLDPEKPYKYSDISMNLLYEIFSSVLRKNEHIMEVPKNKKAKKEFNHFEEFLQQKFYRELGMQRTVYRPLRFFPPESIVPTENETYWRKQLLRGHVHDPYAAILGGVAGNAGLFTNVTDLASLFQMWLNKGRYDGKVYLKPETVALFTSRQAPGHRGLGFNKPSGTGGFGIPEETPLSTFGHTGFTGICSWADPDNELIYIFMCNRVHPKVDKKIYQLGVRKRVFQAIYDAFL